MLVAAAPIDEWVPGASDRPFRPPPVPVPAPEDDALAPNWFGGHERMRRDRLPTPPWTPGKVFGVALVVLALGLFVALVVLSGLEHLGVVDAPDAPEAPAALTSADLAFASALNLAMFLVPALVYVAAFYPGEGFVPMRWRLLMRSDAAFRDVAIGVGAGIGLVLVGIVVLALLGVAGVSTENPVVEALGPELTWPVIVLIAVSSGLAEEVFFRGLLQGRMGIVPANVVFGFAHLDYGTPLQVLLPMGLGFAFSWLALRTRSLYPAIIAHGVFNFIMLTMTKLTSDLGWGAAALM